MCTVYTTLAYSVHVKALLVCMCVRPTTAVSDVPCRWIPALKNIFLLGSKRKQIPLDRMEPFFNGVAVVMTNQLREMALKSITDYLRVFCPVKVLYSNGTVTKIIVGVGVGYSALSPLVPNSTLHVQCTSVCSVYEEVLKRCTAYAVCMCNVPVFGFCSGDGDQHSFTSLKVAMLTLTSISSTLLHS